MGQLKTIKFSEFLKDKKIEIPVFVDKVSAGFPSPASDYIEHKLDLNNYLISNPAATFIVKASGTSMIDANIQSGDLLIVDKSLTPKNNSIVIASIFGDLTVKRLKKKNKAIFLVANNTNYPSFEIKEETDCFIWGVVTYVIHSTNNR
ncbi:MAG: LexA repressor [Alphaproteobacteria bacterium MarineAlpha5_Bin12]|nr:MAG: LexA repressor [Alphaproteobacteria bacterium MarineAlpha5_Bin12]|tara:strand:- start:1599 stop:2042 length:444 start_codon:yes stop_codon:yes gene_type:complete